MKIAVVIPARDEAGEIAGAIQSASAPGVEVTVVDGESRDDTAGTARALGAEVISSKPGRARQLQRGVERSSGEVILFLHADTRLPPGWEVAVRRAMTDPEVCGGAFRFGFEEQTERLRMALRLVAWGAQLRHTWLGQPYGDQGIFVRRTVLQAIGGVPDVALMEDLDLVSELKRRGRLVQIDAAVATSSRRYTDAGVARTVFWHSVAIGARALGVDRRRIAGWLGR